jgi:predicted TIM-barrel fold metal-dependent hydrolase
MAKDSGGLEATKEMTERVKEYTVVDMDIHEIPSPRECYLEHIDDEYKNRVKNIISTDEPLKRALGTGLSADLDPSPHGLPEEVTPMTPEGIKAFMDFFNTDYVVLHGHQGESLAAVSEKKFAMALCRAYNDFVLEEFLSHAEGIKGSIRVPPQAPHLAAEEIDRLADESEMAAVHISFSHPDRLLGDSYYDPIYEAAEDHGFPIDYHPGNPYPAYGGHSGGPVQLESSLGDRIANTTQMGMSHVSSIVFQGVPERFPDLEHLFVEIGIAFLPFLMGKMDKNYDRRNHALKWLEQKPSDYLKEHFYFSNQPLEETAGTQNLRKIFDMIDARELLIYSTDFPHFNVDYPSILNIPQLDEETERAIFGENAAQALGL